MKKLNLMHHFERGIEAAMDEIEEFGYTSAPDNTLAAACINDNSLRELEEAAQLIKDGYYNETDCKNWGITPEEWAYQLGFAFECMNFDARESEGL